MSNLEWIEKYINESMPPAPAQGVEEDGYPVTPVVLFERKDGEYVAKNGKIVPVELLMNRRHFINDDYGYFVSDSRWQQGHESERERLFKSDPVNFLLSNAMRYLNETQLISLRDALIERTPQPAHTCCARWVKASERLPDKELGRVFAKYLGVKNNLHYIFNAWTLSSNAKTIKESDLINIEWLDESPVTLEAGWMPGTPPLDKPCVFVSKSGSDYSVWEVTRLNTVDGSYLAICDGTGKEWGDISDFRCDSYYMLSPSTFPTREQAEEWANTYEFRNEKTVPEAAMSMYDWILSQLNQRQ